MKTGTTIRNKGIFVLNYFARPKKIYFREINGKSISDNKKNWKTIKSFFSNKANLESIIDTSQNHESVPRIKLANFHSKSSLKFNCVSELDVKKEILNLSSKKGTRKGDIPAKMLINSINAYLSELTILINNCLKEGVFSDDLKLADITPIFKKEGSLNKENYRPARITPHLSKMFGRILYKQIDSL